MPAYEYTALSPTGRTDKGLLEAESPRQARQLLRERGLSPLTISEVAQQASPSGQGASALSWLQRRSAGMSGPELSLFTRQLSTLSRSGLPLDEALTAVSQQTEEPRTQRIALALRARISEGESLALALAQYPQAFPVLYRATVDAGEQAGKLDYVLDRLADYVERQQEMSGKVQQAAIYPIIMLVVALGVIMGMMTYVVPQVVSVFDSIHAELPLLTRGLIALSSFLRKFGLLMGIAVIAGVFLFRRALQGEAFRHRFHARMLHWPIAGRIVRAANTGRFMRTLGILFSSGVPILDAMRIGTQVVENLPMRAAIEDAAKRVREGAGVGRSLGASKLFPPIVVHLIASGETSGKLDEMLLHAADNQEREVETRVAVLMKLMEPMMTLVMGGVVLLIVLAILLPIFDLNTLVK